MSIKLSLLRYKYFKYRRVTRKRFGFMYQEFSLINLLIVINENIDDRRLVLIF